MRHITQVNKIILKTNGTVKGTCGVIRNNLSAIESYAWSLDTSYLSDTIFNACLHSLKIHCLPPHQLAQADLRVIPRAIKDAIEAGYENMSSST
jgi:hypothetical protein